MDINAKGLELLYSFEGRHEKLPDGRYRAYLDKVASPPVWTLYAGLTKGVREGMIVTEAQGDAMVRKELNVYEDAIERLVKVPLNENQFSALTCLVYNIGTGAFAKSTFLKRLNAGKTQEAAVEFLKWNKAGGRTIKGLARRRQAEMALFLTEVEDEAIVPPDPMPQRVEPANPTVPQVVKQSPTAAVSLLGIVLGFLQQGWTFIVSLFKDAGAEAVTTTQAIGPFDALFKAIGANMPQITIAILMATLVVVLVRKINAGKA